MYLTSTGLTEVVSVHTKRRMGRRLRSAEWNLESVSSITLPRKAARSWTPDGVLVSTSDTVLGRWKHMSVCRTEMFENPELYSGSLLSPGGPRNWCSESKGPRMIYVPLTMVSSTPMILKLVSNPMNMSPMTKPLQSRLRMGIDLMLYLAGLESLSMT